MSKWCICVTPVEERELTDFIIKYNIFAVKDLSAKKIKEKKRFVFTSSEIDKAFGNLQSSAKSFMLGEIKAVFPINSKNVLIDYFPFLKMKKKNLPHISGLGLATRIELMVYRDLFRRFGDYKVFTPNGGMLVPRKKQLEERYRTVAEQTGKPIKLEDRSLKREIVVLEQFLRVKTLEKLARKGVVVKPRIAETKPETGIFSRVKNLFRRRAK